MNTAAPPVNGLVISEHLKDNPFFNRFYQHFIQGKLKTPSFPDVALNLRRAIQQDREISDVVKIINMDPVISARLIQVVNSPLYRPVTPITNCLNAVNRLGLNNTRNLVIAFSLKNLLKSETPLIKKLIQDNWLQSVKVSSMSYILAQLTKKVDPEEALLAGLLHNIGVLPILTFADSLAQNSYRSEDIDLCSREIHGQIGSFILEKWEFPDKLKQIPLQSTSWFTTSSQALNLIDIVLLAKYHYFLANPGGAELPIINALPAFQKLENQSLTPEMSLQILQDAQQLITETMSFFTH
jgi:HD-like signal output (HDOD) protein